MNAFVLVVVCPSLLVIVTFTGPALLAEGVFAEILLLSLAVPEAVLEPKFTFMVPVVWKPAPLMVTLSPPAIPPVFGSTQ